MSWLIIVTGRPTSGKSTLAAWLGKYLGYPVISKDGIKEMLFDQLGWRDREWSKALGRASVELMFYYAQAQLEAGRSVILDNAFHPDLASARLREFKQQYEADSLQIICDADSEILYRRFKDRARSGMRHEGHVDWQSEEELKQNLQHERPLMLDIGGHVLQVDTNDFEKLNYDSMLKQVKALMLLDS